MNTTVPHSPRRLLLAGMLACLSLLAPPMAGAAGPGALQLDIGDPARRDRNAPLVLDAITDTRSGELITPREMARRLAGTGILFIGEEHTNREFHAVQLRTLQALHEAGREVLVGLEMFPYTRQEVLDHWHARRLTEQGFVDISRWYENWGYHWDYYRDIFLYARANGLRLYAVNSPREVVKSIRNKGFTGLSAEEAAHLPPALAPESEEHRRMYRAFFDADDALHMNAEALDGLYRAQTMWDATMGWNALQALKQHGGRNAIMVVLIGAGHVTYGLGSERQIAAHYEGEIASLIPVSVEDELGKPVEEVRASYATFLWGVPREAYSAHPALGVSLMGKLGVEPSKIIRVGRGSPAERAGLVTGDVLVDVDGAAIGAESDLQRVLSGHRWGDEIDLTIRRGAGTLRLAVPLRR